jgi:hypothetical protein
VDPGQRDLLEPGARDRVDLLEYGSRIDAAAVAARRRNDAIRAGLIAAGLDAQRVCSAPGNTRLNRRAAAAISFTVSLRRRR